MVKATFFTTNLSRHFYYFFGFQFINAIVHLVILSIISFFHFLLDHRMADIQDWVFFHGWEVLALGKIIALVAIFRFLGILSFERKPLLHLLAFNRGFWRKELFICISFSLIGILFLGSPIQDETYEFNLYRFIVNLIGVSSFYLGEGLLVLALNKWLPLKRGQFSIEVVCFSLISFLIHKNLFVYGQGWNGVIIFHLIMVFSLLKMRGDFSWLHSFLWTLLFLVPLAIGFGMDPIWTDQFSPFEFLNEMTGIEVGVFTLLTLFYVRRRKLGGI